MAMLFAKLYWSRRQVKVLLVVMTCAALAYVLLIRWKALLVVSVHVGLESRRGTLRLTSMDAAALGTGQLNREEGFQLLQGLVRHGLLDFEAVSKVRLSRDESRTTDMDEEILLDDRLRDLTTVASPETSQLRVVALRQSSTRRFGSARFGSGDRQLAVGDRVTVRVDLRDEVGRAVLKGGGEVRVWAVRRGTDGRAGTDRRRRSSSAAVLGDRPPGGLARHWKAAAVDVRDMRNGSYVASLPVLWSGEVEVRAALLRPREFRRLVLKLMDTMKMMNQVVAAFSSGSTEQVTLCSFLPVVPGFSDVCNLTAANSGLPWYCGRPSKPPLTCADWRWSRSTGFPLHYPLTRVEQALMNRFIERNRSLFLLKETVTLAVAETGMARPTRNKICHSTPPRDTWTDQSPRGFWDNDQWRPLGCDLPRLTTSLVSRCLGNTTVLVLGDSNAEQILWVLNQTAAECRRVPDPDLDRDLEAGGLHEPLHLRCSGGTFLSWFPHAYPFFSGVRGWTDARAKHAPSHVIDRIPAGSGSYVIVIHLYMHFSQAHTAVYALHARDTARAVRRVLARNPGVRVFIRGPHAVGGNMYCLTGDYHAERCLRVLRDEFRGLRDRVFFLNTWDMTVANENYDIHPSLETVKAVTRLMLSNVCSPEQL